MWRLDMGDYSVQWHGRCQRSDIDWANRTAESGEERQSTGSNKYGRLAHASGRWAGLVDN